MDRGDRHLRRSGVVSLLVVGIALAVLASPAAAVDPYTWFGEGVNPNWSNTNNWSSVFPVTNATSLTFPALLGPGCDPVTAADACYRSENDVSGLSVDSVSIDGDEPYDIAGDGITLGAGGLTVTGAGTLSFDTPVTLGASQTWAISAGRVGIGAVTGTSHALNIDFAPNSDLYPVGSDIEVGPLSLTGPGGMELNSGTPSPGGPAANINSSDGQSVSLGSGTHLGIDVTNTNVGPLSSAGATILIGAGTDPEPTLSVKGSVNLDAQTALRMFVDHSGATPGNFSQLTASGNVSLAGSLTLKQWDLGPDACHDLTPGDTYPLISTTGSLAGTFTGAANGSTVTIAQICNTYGAGATARINYSSHAVTVTILTGGDAVGVPANAEAPEVTGSARSGQVLSASPGTWFGAASFAFAYQWEECNSNGGGCAAIAGATGTTYKLTPSEVGHTVAVSVTAANAQGTSSAVASAVTAQIGPPLPTGAQVLAALAKILKPTGKNAAIHRILENGGYTFVFPAPSAGVLKLHWLVRPKGKTVFLATGTATPTAAGRVRFKLVLNRTGKRLLKHARRFGLRAYASFTPTGAPLRNAQKTFKLRR